MDHLRLAAVLVYCMPMPSALGVHFESLLSFRGAGSVVVLSAAVAAAGRALWVAAHLGAGEPSVTGRRAGPLLAQQCCLWHGVAGHG